MMNGSARTVYKMYCILLLFLSFVICCQGKSFDWGTMGHQRYGVREEENNELFTQDVRMPEVAQPETDDVYMCTSVQMPRRDAYIVGYEPRATMRTAHHMLLYGCGDINSSPGQAYKCGEMGICKGGNSNIMFAWARNAPAPSIPDGVGFHVGGLSGINYVTLQVHYGHKDAFEEGEVDTSGLKLTMTFTPQPYLAGIYLLVSGDINVPPNSKNIHADIACQYRDSTPIYPFAFRTHAHDLGKVISGYLIKGQFRGKWDEIAKGDPNWPQAFYPMRPHIEIQQGDWLAARCTYESDRTDTTRVGSTGEDEMCNLYLMYYTDAETGKPFDVCGTRAAGEIESHFPFNSDIPPAKMPEMIQQPPAGKPYYPYGNDYYPDYYNGGPIGDIYNQNGYNNNDDILDWNPDKWVIDDGTDEDDDKDEDVKIPETKTETEKPSKTEDDDDNDEIFAATKATPSDTSTKKNEEEEEEEETPNDINEETADDIGSGKLTLSDWHTDDSVTLGQVAGLSVDKQGNVHVFHRRNRIWDMQSFDSKNKFTQADDGPIVNSTVIAFHPDTGKIMHQWGAKTNTSSDCLTCFNGFYLPHGLSIDHEGNVWLTDVALHQVFKFPAGGADTPLLTLGEKLTPGSDKDHFCKPADVVVDPKTGNFFVADGYCNSRIMKFSPQGDFLMEWGKMAFKPSGYASDAFIIPHSITYVEDRDVVCVADREHGRIQCFTSGGVFVESYQRDVFGGRVFAVHYNPWNGGVLYAVNGPSSDRVPVQGFTLGYDSRQVTQTWKPNVEFQNPHDVECTADNTAVYVAEIGPNKVWKFDVDVALDNRCETKCTDGTRCYYSDSVQKYRCACPYGFTGTSCLEVISTTASSSSSDPCLSNPCSNHGTCVSSGGSHPAGFYCFCHDGFYGSLCQNSETPDVITTSTDVCQPNPCQNQGTCFQSARSAGMSSTYFCICASEFYGIDCQYSDIVTPAALEEDAEKEGGGTTNDIAVSHKSTGSNGQVVKSLKTEKAGLTAAKTDETGHTITASDANTATTAIIVAVLAVPIVLMMMVAVAVRLRAQGKMKFGSGNGFQKGYNSTSNRFSLGNFFNRRKGFNQVSTEDSDLDGGMEWSEESDIEEYSSLNSTKVSQNL